MSDTEKQSGEIQTFPAPEAAPKPLPVPSHRPREKNFADKAETVIEVIKTVLAHVRRVDSQSAWEVAQTEWDIADEMYRGAKTPTELDAEEAANRDDTRSNVRSASFYTDVRMISAFDATLILGGRDEAMVTYAPVPNTNEYTEEEGQVIAKAQKSTLDYYFNMADMAATIRRILLMANKYSDRLMTMEWDRRVAYIEEKVPVFDKDDRRKVREPIDWKWERKERVISDCPRLYDHDLKDCYFDAMIQEFQNQPCILIRKPMQYETLAQMQRAGGIMNLSKVGAEQRHQGESERLVVADRQDNAGESADSTQGSSLVDFWCGWVRVPVNDKTGEWDAEGEVSHWYKVAFAGNLLGATEVKDPETGKTRRGDPNVVCLQLVPVPWGDGIPAQLVCSQDDDKGALHSGYISRVKSIIAAEMTTLDQHIDHNTKRIRMPWFLDRGSVNIRDKVFAPGGNRVWWMRPGSREPHIPPLPAYEMHTMPMLTKLAEMRQQTMGLNNIMMGVPSGGRTSASAELAALDQATRPAIWDTTFKGKQIMPFVAMWVQRLSRRYADPAVNVTITGTSGPMEMKPSKLWGDLKIEIVSPAKLIQDFLKRRDDTVFLGQFIPIAQQFMKPEALVQILRESAESHGYKIPESAWRTMEDLDSARVARSENVTILGYGVEDMPQPGENDAAHLRIHEPAFDQYLALPKEEQNQRNAEIMQRHIEMHQEQQKSLASGPQLAMPQGQAPQTPGEAAGEQIAAKEGAAMMGEAPAVTPATGRPPMYGGPVEG